MKNKRWVADVGLCPTAIVPVGKKSQMGTADFFISMGGSQAYLDGTALDALVA
ncbi:hypothetical protein NKJ88_10625 [Mesorhizobium sp. M0016]|uniref:hypothetical protein n=1 Tax=Mesorhizobium sp. M0016 TaxID=2956843 RepID=UPI00333C8CD9